MAMREDYDPPEKKIEKFWKNTFRKASEEKIMLKDLTLPLARIKRLMKVEEGVRMVASEVPILFSKIAEKFVEELTFRAWINTEENKRRILQRGDISVAVKTSEMYDFLFYIVPRNDISTAFDRMLNTKLMVDNKNIHERSFFENHSHDRFNLGNTRVSDMNQERNITQDYTNQERNITQDFMNQERNITQDFMNQERNISQDYTNQERNITQDFMNQERNITQDFMNERHMNTDYSTKPLSKLDFNTNRSIDLNFPRSESGLSLEFTNEQQSQEFSKIGFGLEKPFKDLPQMDLLVVVNEDSDIVFNQTNELDRLANNQLCNCTEKINEEENFSVENESGSISEQYLKLIKLNEPEGFRSINTTKSEDGKEKYNLVFKPSASLSKERQDTFNNLFIKGQINNTSKDDVRVNGKIYFEIMKLIFEEILERDESLNLLIDFIKANNCPENNETLENMSNEVVDLPNYIKILLNFIYYALFVSDQDITSFYYQIKVKKDCGKMEPKDILEIFFKTFLNTALGNQITLGYYLEDSNRIDGDLKNLYGYSEKLKEYEKYKIQDDLNLITKLIDECKLKFIDKLNKTKEVSSILIKEYKQLIRNLKLEECVIPKFNNVHMEVEFVLNELERIISKRRQLENLILRKSEDIYELLGELGLFKKRNEDIIFNLIDDNKLNVDRISISSKMILYKERFLEYEELFISAELHKLFLSIKDLFIEKHFNFNGQLQFDKKQIAFNLQLREKNEEYSGLFSSLRIKNNENVYQFIDFLLGNQEISFEKLSKLEICHKILYIEKMEKEKTRRFLFKNTSNLLKRLGIVDR
ncbi:hypothetical protein evm_013947 [Chilo suppressalis]|nr:hypothetical protein evm_013947 [Chilo suppressalis]